MFTLLPAQDNLKLFTKTQNIFWKRLYGDAALASIVNRTDFNPQAYLEFLPNIWLGDLIIDEDNKLIDLETRLFGTKLAEFYGERTNQKLLDNNNTKSLKNQMRSTHQRTLNAVSEMFERSAPMYSHVEYIEEDKNYVSATGLLFPMCKNSSSINMVLGYVEVSFRDV